MNIVTLIGNLATDVDLKQVEPDKKVANFLLAVDRVGTEGADFVSVSAWDRQAELCAEYLSKGRRVAIDGRLHSHTWEDKAGKHTKLEVVARRVEFLSGSPKEEHLAEVIPLAAS